MREKYGPVTGHKYLAWIETEQGLVAVDTGWDLAEGEPYEGSDVQALRQASSATGKPLTHVLLTHGHPDHVANLPFLLEQWPMTKVYAHANCQVDGVTERLVGGERLEIGGELIEALYTPGHSMARDELCYHLPVHRFLFSGDVAQPQGPNYAFANGPSPVPYFYHGNDYRRSLGTLLDLDAHYMRTGHGDFLGPEQVKQWLRVTLATVTRIEELAIELTERYPDRESEWIVELIYDQIADERHFGLRRANERKRQSTFPGATDYERFDKPGILWAVEQARTWT